MAQPLGKTGVFTLITKPKASKKADPMEWEQASLTVRIE
jgi:hypothetical protein